MKLWSLIKKWLRKLFCKEKTSDVKPVTPAIVESIKEDEDMLRNSIIGAAGSSGEVLSLDFAEYTLNPAKSSITYHDNSSNGPTLGLLWTNIKIRGVSASPDGTKLYLHDANQAETYEMIGAGPWDFSSLSVGYTRTVDTQGMQTTPAWSPDGTRYYMISGQTSPKIVYQYNVSTPFSLASASYAGQSSVMSSVVTNDGYLDRFNKIGTLLLDGDGSQFYITDDGGFNTKIYGATMSTNFEVTTSSLISSTATPFQAQIRIWGGWIHPKGKLFVTAGIDSIDSYQLEKAFDFTTAVLQSRLTRADNNIWSRGVSVSDDLSKLVVYDCLSQREHYFSVYEKL